MVMGLPIHPLVVHFSVVLVPLAFVALLAVVAVKSWRARYAHLAVTTAVAAAIFSVIARFSGGALAAMAGGAPSDHAYWGNLLMYASLVSAALSLVWFAVARKQDEEASTLGTILGWLAVVAAGATMALAMLAGHTGAESVWGSLGTDSNAGEATPAATADEAASAGASSPSEAGAVAALTMTEVASHNTAESCYAVVKDSVYDLTEWISKHPGGAGAIEGMCGTDATAAFEGKHGGSEDIAKTLEKFKIASLQK